MLNLALSKIYLRDNTRSAILAPVEVLLLLALSNCYGCATDLEQAMC